MKKKTIPTKQRFFYYEDPDVWEYMNNLPYMTKSIFVRQATREKMLRDNKKKLSTPKR